MYLNRQIIKKIINKEAAITISNTITIVMLRVSCPFIKPIVINILKNRTIIAIATPNNQPTFPQTTLSLAVLKKQHHYNGSHESALEKKTNYEVTTS